MVVIQKSMSILNLKGEKGFSLIELLTVMVIITILVGIAVAIFSDASEKPANEVHYANERTIISAMHMALSDHGSEAFMDEENNNPVWSKNKPNNSSVPCWSGYLQEWPSVPEESKYSDDGDYVVYLDFSGSPVKVDVVLE